MDTEREKSFTRVRGQDSETPGSRLVARKIPSQNVVSRLVCRELFGTRYRWDFALCLAVLDNIKLIFQAE